VQVRTGGDRVEEVRRYRTEAEHTGLHEIPPKFSTTSRSLVA
jgi:hypothetical protein